MSDNDWSDNAQVCNNCWCRWEPECIRDDFCHECDSENVMKLKLMLEESKDAK